MQNAKDTFYTTLRNRLAALNPNRVMILRGIQRPGILVEDAEVPMAQMPADVFVLRWTALAIDTQLPSALAQLRCEIHYATGGTQSNSGLDRGRALEEMDAELLAILNPPASQKVNYVQTTGPTAMGTRIFWSTPVFEAAVTSRERLTRIATIDVFAFQEQGEL